MTLKIANPEHDLHITSQTCYPLLPLYTFDVKQSNTATNVQHSGG